MATFDDLLLDGLGVVARGRQEVNDEGKPIIVLKVWASDLFTEVRTKFEHEVLEDNVLAHLPEHKKYALLTLALDAGVCDDLDDDLVDNDDVDDNDEEN